jgi:DNA-directed RNA polymerase subunit beta'
VLQYFISTHGARKGLADTALKTANSGYLTRRLVDVTQDLVVTEDDCETEQRRGDEGAGRRRRSHRAAARAHPRPSWPRMSSCRKRRRPCFYPGTLLGEDEVEQIEALGIDEVKVRTPLTCETRHGLCANCYGRDLGRGHLVNVGEAVGVIAAQSIGEPGTQLTMRTFHIGGAASRTAAVSQIEAKSAGTIRFSSLMRYVTSVKGDLVVIARSGEVTIHDDNGRERERHKVPYGATLQVKDGDTVKAGKVLATWDATARPIITEYAGRVKFENVEEGVTVAKQVDDVTGLTTLVVIDPKRRGDVDRQGRASAGEAPRRQRRGDQARGLGPAGQHHVPAGLHHHGEGRPAGRGGRGARAYSAGDVEDARHHGRSAACGRALRSALAEGRGHARRSHRARCRSARIRRASSAWSSPTSDSVATST